jgi:hypothetical protein
LLSGVQALLRLYYAGIRGAPHTRCHSADPASRRRPRRRGGGAAAAARRRRRRPPRTNDRNLTPRTAAAGPIDPATAWPNGLRRQKPEVCRLLQPQTVWPGSAWIDRTSGRGPGDRFLLTIPECMHISSRWARGALAQSAPRGGALGPLA